MLSQFLTFAPPVTREPVVEPADSHFISEEAAVLKFLGRVKLFQRLPKDRPTGHNLPALQQYGNICSLAAAAWRKFIRHWPPLAPSS